ncbi:Response regulator receiver domain-containing protein [Streptomyces sp. DvalAA-14]|uniref:response regulator n=1 Tax=unclassified Streptomyces TaxID=2593676 RepID=UPI00081B54A1|nr:response regulator [Streptomyces sp. DvalAA-14]SCE46661.1 Response regulator receiver domain-containing protein [Streptomyces sp. DvalAA-14]
MPPERSTPQLDHGALTALAERAVEDLAHRLATQVYPAPRAATSAQPAGPAGPAGGDSGPDDSGDRGPGAGPDDPLARLRVLSYILRAVDSRAAHEASAAARQGATYPDLGRAWGITRQGARRRWPGLVFTARPPSRPVPAQIRRSASVNALLPTRTYSVLLVEDDPADALLIEEALTDRGVATRSICRANDGIAALEYLRSPDNPRPDLIVLDLNMPRMNGRELLAVLKEDAVLGMIPVVVLTTSSTPSDISAAYHQHANAYVTKPVNLDDFLEAVRGIDDFFFETASVVPLPE